MNADFFSAVERVQPVEFVFLIVFQLITLRPLFTNIFALDYETVKYDSSISTQRERKKERLLEDVDKH